MDTTIQRAVAGDADAIGALYQQHDGKLRAYLAYRLSADDIEDVLQDIWVKALRALPSYEDRGYPFSAWLYRIAQGRAIDRTRYERRHPRLPLLDCHTAPGPEDGIAAWDARAAVAELLGVLSTEQQRRVIVRRFLLDESVEETAAAMGLSVGAMKALQHRALATMRRTCGDSGRPAV